MALPYFCRERKSHGKTPGCQNVHMDVFAEDGGGAVGAGVFLFSALN